MVMSCLSKKLPTVEKQLDVKKETAYFRLCCVRNLLMSSKLITLKIQFVSFFMIEDKENNVI